MSHLDDLGLFVLCECAACARGGTSVLVAGVATGAVVGLAKRKRQR